MKKSQPKTSVSFWRGWNLAFEALGRELSGLRDESLSSDAKGFKEAMLDWLDARLIDEDEFKPQPSNTDLATKYAVCLRTVTNWRKKGCPFEAGQWRVLDWMADRRYVPAKAKAKFARQLARRAPPQPGSVGELACQVRSLLFLTKRAKREGLI